MKTYQLILATALVALAACNKEEVVNTDVNLDNEIGFVAVNRKATKANDAIISGTTYAETNSFRLWGWQSQAADFSEFDDDDASNFMSNLKIEFCDGPDGRANAWRNDAHYYYWPLTGKLSFLAIHPYEIATATTGWDATNDVPKAAIENYTITPGTNETVDLMFATNEGTRQSVIVDGTGKVGLVFKHALSQIEVKVKTDDDYSRDVKFDVLGVTFNKIDLSGNVAYVNDVISWTENTTQTQDWVYYNAKKFSEQYEENSEPVYVSDSYKVYGAAKVNIPQPANFDASALDPGHAKYNAEDAVKATITIGYSMEQTGSAKITGTVTIADPFLSNVENAWEAGKKYNYTINFRLNEILFNPSVTDWVDVDVTTINIY